jgi:hypothetical protein
VPARAATDLSGVVFCVVRRSSCRSIMLRQEELAFIKAISTLQLSPAFLRELRTALSRRKKNPAVPAGSRNTAPGGGAEAPNDQPESSRASAKPTSWLDRATHRSQQTGALRLAKRPRQCPRVHRQSRANKLLRAAGNSVRPRVGRRTRLS